MKLRRASNSGDSVIEGGDDTQQHNAQRHQTQRHSLPEEATHWNIDGIKVEFTHVNMWVAMLPTRSIDRALLAGAHLHNGWEGWAATSCTAILEVDMAVSLTTELVVWSAASREAGGVIDSEEVLSCSKQRLLLPPLREAGGGRMSGVEATSGNPHDPEGGNGTPSDVMSVLLGSDIEDISIWTYSPCTSEHWILLGMEAAMLEIRIFFSSFVRKKVESNRALMTSECSPHHSTVWVFDCFDSVASVITGHVTGPPHDLGVTHDQPERAFIAKHYFLPVCQCPLLVFPPEIQTSLLHSLRQKWFLGSVAYWQY
ncbi:hypothetical protein E2C01_024082 [Portunus trituberculatus]|uniref:Uncharacterized protein n=1 Tax=Portunus trituberculatus TaxID=210409 RepID=A0A5B7EDG3_PORTR|nr:hypothetical protein [Portunus trituberculatus]